MDRASDARGTHENVPAPIKSGRSEKIEVFRDGQSNYRMASYPTLPPQDDCAALTCLPASSRSLPINVSTIVFITGGQTAFPNR